MVFEFSGAVARETGLLHLEQQTERLGSVAVADTRNQGTAIPIAGNYGQLKQVGALFQIYLPDDFPAVFKAENLYAWRRFKGDGNIPHVFLGIEYQPYFLRFVQHHKSFGQQGPAGPPYAFEHESKGKNDQYACRHLHYC